MSAPRWAVVRVPASGPPALAGAPNDFATKAEAEARVAQIEAAHVKAEDSYLDVVRYEGERGRALALAGILI